MNNFLTTLLLFTILCLGAAHGQTSFKIGASAGNGLNKGLFELDSEDFSVDKTDLAFKAYAALSGKYFGLEAGYRNLGKVELSQDGVQGFSQSKGIDILGTGTINMGPIALFGKAGAYVGTTHNQLKGLSTDPDIDALYTQASFTWGTGLAVNLGLLHFRAEYEKIMLPNQPLGMISFGAGINFW